MIAVMAITLVVEVPIDDMIAKWTEATLPSDWQEIRAIGGLHRLRTFLSLGAVGAAVAAALTTRPVDRDMSRSQSRLVTLRCDHHDLDAPFQQSG